MVGRCGVLAGLLRQVGAWVPCTPTDESSAIKPRAYVSRQCGHWRSGNSGCAHRVHSCGLRTLISPSGSRAYAWSAYQLEVIHLRPFDCLLPSLVLVANTKAQPICGSLGVHVVGHVMQHAPKYPRANCMHKCVMLGLASQERQSMYTWGVLRFPADACYFVQLFAPPSVGILPGSRYRFSKDKAGGGHWVGSFAGVLWV